ncbi:MAG TPA: hypothetical protein VJN18_20030 [Polyangiaceae bacterium]|nr:hypothetical protein [Polyangiaceae bacterium]
MEAQRSSTSSSRARLGPPWGLAIAAILLLGLELMLRRLNPTGNLPPLAGEREFGFRAVTFEIQQGAPDVAVIGTSRARRGVLAPVLREALEKQGLAGSVKNFSLGGAQAEELELMVRRIGESGRRPKLVLWPLTAKELRHREEAPSKSWRYLARFSDWLDARGRLGARVDQHLPDALRNEAARGSHIVRCRFALRDMLVATDDEAEAEPENRWETFKNVFVPTRSTPSPMQGGLPGDFMGSKRNASRKVSRQRVKRYLGDAFTQPNWPRNYQAERLEATVRHVRELGIPLLLVEIPVHELLEKGMPRKTQQKFRRYMSAVAREHGAPFVTVEELGVSFEPKDFREQSHLNYRGALKYTSAITPLVVRALKGQAAP